MISKNTLTLKQFMKRQEVLSCYRDLMRAISKIDVASDRNYLKKWVYDEFQSNKSIPVTDEESINYHLLNAKKALKQLKVAQNLSK